MNFIFPKNYNFKNKLLGIFDYSTIFVNFIWCVLVYIFINLFFHNLNIKIFLFILLCLPFLLISISGFNGENFLYAFRYIFNFYIKQKLFLYSKRNS